MSRRWRRTSFDAFRSCGSNTSEVPFPGRRAEDVDGIDLMLVDTEAAGCISTFLGNQGRLDPDQLRILRRISGDLHRVVPHLTGAMATYFAQLAQVSSATVQFCATFPRHP